MSADLDTYDAARGWLRRQMAIAKLRPDKLTVCVTVITPALVDVLLNEHEANRPIDKDSVDRAEALIRAGQWQQDAAITLSISRGVIDGHHRLQALLITGISVQGKLLIGAFEEVA